VAAILVNFFMLPLTYRATASLLPETERSKLSALNQFSGLASLAGVNLQGSDVSRLYPSIIMSHAVLDSVVLRRYGTKRYPEPVTLIRYFENDDENPAKAIEKTLEDLTERMSATLDQKTGIVSLSVELREPQLASDVLNAVIGELDTFMREKKTSSAGEQARWISDRLEAVEAELRRAEDALAAFRVRNRRVSDSPELLLQQERLLREVTVKSTVFVELKKQYELARIEEIKNLTVVNVLDEARPPVRKEHPKRATNTALTMLFAFLCGSAYYGLRPQAVTRWAEFLQRMRRP
jgi:uncharacterized protein involved in exopolysaccharide biosynthesis